MVTELSILIPTYNERENIKECVDRVAAVLPDVAWEIVFIDDDSPDGTSSCARRMAREDARIRCLQRLGRKGLASACIEGILSTASPYICIMDADLQHDERILPDMLDSLRNEDLDLVIGSRYIDTGSTGEMPRHRVLISRFATFLADLLLRHRIKDPMSGYFMFSRDFFERTMRGLSGKGFKILFDLLMSSREPVKFRELPYRMRQRARGESKLDFSVAWEFLFLILDKLLGRILPIRFILFAVVGFSGVFVHLLTLGLLHRLLDVDFFYAQLAATLTAMTSNFILNNTITYRDMKLKGLGFMRGLVSFYISCSFGALINILLAGTLYDQNFSWWLAGVLGAVTGSIWNYAVTSVLTWRTIKSRS